MGIVFWPPELDAFRTPAGAAADIAPAKERFSCGAGKESVFGPARPVRVRGRCFHRPSGGVERESLETAEVLTVIG